MKYVSFMHKDGTTCVVPRYPNRQSRAGYLRLISDLRCHRNRYMLLMMPDGNSTVPTMPSVGSRADYLLLIEKFRQAEIGPKGVRFALAKNCEYCGVLLDRRDKWTTPTIDHVVPRVKGGTNHVANTKVCCFRCNMRKRARTVTAFLKEIRHERRTRGDRSAKTSAAPNGRGADPGELVPAQPETLPSPAP